MDLAFALSRIGHTEYTALIAASDAFDPRTAAPAERALQQAFVDRFNVTRDKFVEIAMAMYAGEADAPGDEYERNVATPDFWIAGHMTRMGWTIQRSDEKWMSSFVSPAQLITELPASEAIAERLFSVLTAVFDTRRECSGIDLMHGSMMPQTCHREQIGFVASAVAGVKCPFAVLRGFDMERRRPALDLKAKVSSVHASAYVHLRGKVQENKNNPRPGRAAHDSTPLRSSQIGDGSSHRQPLARPEEATIGWQRMGVCSQPGSPER
jgi:hypothetical protein